MNHVIEHLPVPELAIQKIHSMLSTGGKLILGTPNFDSGAARRYGSKFRLLADPTHISLFSEDSLRRFLRDNGFRIDFVEYPYFDTDWFNQDSLLNLLEKDIVSPPFYGSFITVFASKID
jgi:2-polyprenyl-3-methyl-5-hydroxy-6-metoxy-1,4-benzoquinol methylase